jgi:hypothetical protein
LAVPQVHRKVVQTSHAIADRGMGIHRVRTGADPKGIVRAMVNRDATPNRDVKEIVPMEPGDPKALREIEKVVRKRVPSSRGWIETATARSPGRKLLSR